MLTWSLVVADSKVGRDSRADVGEALTGAVMSGTAQLGGALPYDLGEVAPLFEQRHIRAGLVVKTLEEIDFAIVEEVGDDSGDVTGFDTSSDVLAVTAASSLTGVGQQSKNQSIQIQQRLTRCAHRRSWKLSQQRTKQVPHPTQGGRQSGSRGECCGGR